jgi:hypothetical protein
MVMTDVCYRSISLMAFRSRSLMPITLMREARRVRDGHRIRERMGTHRNAHRARGCSPTRIAMAIIRNDVDAPAV